MDSYSSSWKLSRQRQTKSFSGPYTNCPVLIRLMSYSGSVTTATHLSPLLTPYCSKRKSMTSKPYSFQ